MTSHGDRINLLYDIAQIHIFPMNIYYSESFEESFPIICLENNLTRDMKTYQDTRNSQKYFRITHSSSLSQKLYRLHRSAGFDSSHKGKSYNSGIRRKHYTNNEAVSGKPRPKCSQPKPPRRLCENWW